MKSHLPIPITRPFRSPLTSLRRLGTLILIATLSGCTLFIPKEAGIGKRVDWTDLPGWQQDSVADAWPALLSQCARLPAVEPLWDGICEEASRLPTPDDAAARAFIEAYFQPHEIIGTDGSPEGLITGYYQPTLYGSLQPDARFAYPLYTRPDTLLQIELGDLFPSLKGKRVRGRLEGNRVIPFFDRSDIDGDRQPLKGNELLWVDSPYDAFFLQVQGSGIVELPDGSRVGVGYADQNGHQYVSIGKRLIEWGELTPEEVSLFTIRRWLEENPGRAATLLNENPSYVFFVRSDVTEGGPRGSLNVPLTPERSAAVDRARIPLGTPVWLDTTLPAEGGSPPAPYRRLLFAQDTGGAIKGPVRADVFFGNGDLAERLAGNMKQPGRLFALLPTE